MATFELTDVEGGGSSGEVGQFVGSVANTLGGKALLPCNGSSFNPITYPDLAAVMSSTPLVNNVTTVLTNPGDISSVTGDNAYITGYTVSEDLTTSLVCAETGTSTLQIGYYTNLDTTPIEVVTGSFDASISNTAGHRACINGDGTKGFVAYNDGVQRAGYINVSGTVSSSALTGNVGTINADRVGCDINLVGDLGIMAWYDSGSGQGNAFSVYSTINGGQTWSGYLHTGINNSVSPMGAGVAEGSNAAYILDGTNYGGVNNSRLWKTPDFTTSNSWVEVAQYPFLVPHIAGGGKLYVGSENNIVYTGYSGKVWQTSIDNALISSDGGVTMEQVTLTTSFTDYLGNPATALIKDIRQRKSDDMLLYYIRGTTTINGVSVAYDVYVETLNRDPDWLNTVFAATPPNVNASTPENSDSPITASSNPMPLLAWDSVTQKGLGVARIASTNTNIVITDVDFAARYYTPVIESTKIIAEA